MLVSQSVQSRPDAEREDFEEFFRRVLPRAVAAAQRVTTDRPAAEDAALEALTKAHLRWERLAVEPWRDLWLVRVAVNEALRRLPRVTPTRACVGTSPDMAERVATREMLQMALSTLSRRQCEVVVLRHLVGLSEIEVAAALAIGHGTVKTHLRRGLRVLRERLDGDWREAGIAPVR